MSYPLLALVLICLSTLLVSSQPAQSFTLVKDGKSDYEIVLAKDASPSEKHAADELQKFLEEISGAKLPVVEEPGKQKVIVIGACVTQQKLAPGIDVAALGTEGFTIKTVGSNLIIAGGKQRGTMYGVYSFLEDILGCRWYSSNVSKIPKQKTIRVPSLDITEKPDFEYRDPYYTDSWNGDWAARNKCNGHFPQLDEARGGKITYNRFCHTFDALVPTDKYFQDHPEYFSLVNGKRQGGQYVGQLCLTNPEVQKIVNETVLKWISENPQSKIVSVTQNDNANYCQCEKCKAVDEEEGSPSGVMLRFANSVADEVAKKYPDILIDTFAYWYTERPPKVTKPKSNVRIRLCPISNCQHHPYESCPENKGFMDNLRGWHALTNDTLYIWHYNTNFHNYLLPLPDLDELATSIKLYKNSGVVGVFFQGTYTAGNGPYGGGGWMDNLKAYMLTKMAWNVNTDARKVRNDFLQGYFGNAWKPMGEYIDLLHEKVQKENIHGKIFDPLDKAAFLTDDVMAKCNQLFDQAEKVADGPDEMNRVKHARLSIRYVEVSRQAAKASSGTPEEKRAARENLWKFVKDCKADGITNISEAGSIDAWYQQLATPLK